MRSFLENNSVVDAAVGRTQSQFTWQPGDISITPYEGSIFTVEDAGDDFTSKFNSSFSSTANKVDLAHRLSKIRQDHYDSLVNRDFPVRHEKDSVPDAIPMHPDELHNQIAHRETYHTREYPSMDHPDYNRIRAMRSAHSNYKGSSSFFNIRLRHPDNLRGDHIALENTHPQGFHDGGYGEKHLYDSLDAVTKHPTVRPMSLYRGFGRGLDLRKMAPGTEFMDHGYTGLTHLRHLARGFTETNYGHQADPLGSSSKSVAMVHIPAGTYGHTLDLKEHGGPGLTSLEEEQEFLLHRGTRFRVMGHSLVNHSRSWDGPTHVAHLQVVGQHPLPLRESDKPKEEPAPWMNKDRREPVDDYGDRDR